MKGWSLQARLAVLLLALVALLGTAGALALRGLGQAASSLDTVYRDRVLPLQQLAAISEAYGVGIVAAVERARDGAIPASQALASIDAAQARIDQQWHAYRQTYLVAQEVQLIAETTPLMQRADLAVQQAKGLLLTSDRPGLARFAATDMFPAIAPVIEVLGRLIAVQPEVAHVESESARATYRRTLISAGALVALALTAGGLLTASVLSRHLREKRAADARTARISRFHRALSRTNQLIVREGDAQKLLEGLCRICVDTGHALLASVLLRDGDRARRVVSAGPAAELFAGVPSVVDLTEPRVRISLSCEAMDRGVPAVSDHVATDPRTAPWQERARHHGVRSAAAFPLRRGGAVAGVLVLYAEEPGFFDAPLVQLLVEMVGDVSFALDTIDGNVAHQAAQREVEAGLVRFRQLFYKAPMSIIILARDSGHVRDINDFASERYGLTRADMIGRTMRELGVGLVDKDRERFYALLARDGRVEQMPAQVRGVQGQLREVLTSAEPIDYLGEPCLLAMSLDVTALRAAEQARRAQQEAEAASRAKTEFLSRMSHELRTPLNAVLGFSQLLRGDLRFAADQQAQLGHIHQAGQHLLALINDVLDVARIEEGRLKVATQAVLLGPVVADACRMLAPLAEAQAVRIDPAPPGIDTAWVEADPIRLRQVLINLMSNAVKYNRPGGWVRVELARDADQLWLSVRDNGIGMSAEQLAHLYEPFNRLGRERGAVEGTGIGMVLTRQLVRLMHGQLEVMSLPDQGTQVRLGLPAASAQQALSMAAQQAATAAPAATGAPTGVVLYIEDNPVNLLLVEQMLARWPAVRVVQAENGRTGLDLARTLRPDVVLLDMHLPDLDGAEVLRRLRADPATRGFTVVALSASAMPEEVAEARAAGANDYWTKPFEVEHLLADLRRLLPSRPQDGVSSAAMGWH
ncbi:ATP-binding protein [Ideonella sp.]|uniref:ATP-binding protein n=1 Tax=Ideonella sp. TaxID=1929293 RepID=UPI0035ADB2F5